MDRSEEDGEVVMEKVRAEMAPIYTALEGIQHKLAQLEGPFGPTGPKLASRSDGEEVRAEMAPIYAALEGIQHKLAQLEGPFGPTGPKLASQLEGPFGPTGPKLASRIEGAKGPTGPAQRFVLPRDGTVGPQGPRGLWRGAGDAEPTQLVLPSGAPVHLSPSAKWMWVDGVLVVF